MERTTEQLKPMDERIASALTWLEARKCQRIRRAEYDALTTIYWLLRDLRSLAAGGSDHVLEEAARIARANGADGRAVQQIIVNARSSKGTRNA
jgi:hypothetical protein